MFLVGALTLLTASMLSGTIGNVWALVQAETLPPYLIFLDF